MYVALCTREIRVASGGKSAGWHWRNVVFRGFPAWFERTCSAVGFRNSLNQGAVSGLPVGRHWLSQWHPYWEQEPSDPSDDSAQSILESRRPLSSRVFCHAGRFEQPRRLSGSAGASPSRGKSPLGGCRMAAPAVKSRKIRYSGARRNSAAGTPPAEYRSRLA